MNWVPPQVNREELLDLSTCSPADAAQSLRDLARVHRYLGGQRVFAKLLLPWLGRHKGGQATLLDLGTGSAHIPLSLDVWAERAGVDLHIVALDLKPLHLGIAAKQAQGRGALSFLCADGVKLPLRTGAVDYVISSLFLHHFPAETLVRLLAEARRVARFGIVMNDMARHWVPYLFVLTASPLFARNWVTRHDGPISILRSYTREELIELADQAGLQNFTVHSLWPFRLCLAADLN